MAQLSITEAVWELGTTYGISQDRRSPPASGRTCSAARCSTMTPARLGELGVDVADLDQSFCRMRASLQLLNAESVFPADGTGFPCPSSGAALEGKLLQSIPEGLDGVNVQSKTSYWGPSRTGTSEAEATK